MKEGWQPGFIPSGSCEMAKSEMAGTVSFSFFRFDTDRHIIIADRSNVTASIGRVSLHRSTVEGVQIDQRGWLTPVETDGVAIERAGGVTQTTMRSGALGRHSKVVNWQLVKTATTNLKTEFHSGPYNICLR